MVSLIGIEIEGKNLFWGIVIVVVLLIAIGFIFDNILKSEYDKNYLIGNSSLSQIDLIMIPHDMPLNSNSMQVEAYLTGPQINNSLQVDFNIQGMDAFKKQSEAVTNKSTLFTDILVNKMAVVNENLNLLSIQTDFGEGYNVCVSTIITYQMKTYWFGPEPIIELQKCIQKQQSHTVLN